MVTPEPDAYYRLLGISRGASAVQIKVAYRRLARRWHPDVNDGTREAEETFKAIGEAYGVLSDPVQRQRYDDESTHRRLVATAMSGAAVAPAWSPWSAPRTAVEWRMPSPQLDPALEGAAVFSGLTGMLRALLSPNAAGAAGWAGASGNDLEGILELTPHEARWGSQRTLMVRDPDGHLRRVLVRIPPGVAEGSSLCLEGQGERSPWGGQAGDLYLRVAVRRP